MGSKIHLIGTPKDVRIKDNRVLFRISAEPATRNSPKGLPLFGTVSYRVQCNMRQWKRARFGPDDNSDLIIEGYCEPRRDEETGKLHIAVVAMSVSSTRTQNERKLAQLNEELKKAKRAFAEAREAGAPREELEALAQRLVKANESVQRFRERHPDLAEPKSR